MAALERHPATFRLLLRLRGGGFPPLRVAAPRMNAALPSRAAWEDALERVRSAGLPPHPDAPKNWDGLAALEFILARTSPSARVLDAGGEIYSPLVEWLYQWGYRSLEVLNLIFPAPFRRGAIRYTPGDCTAMPYPDASFDVIVSLSVIEHGVDTRRFLREAGRVLAPGGYLIVSTDYWPERIDTAGLRAYGSDVRIFSRPDIETLQAEAVDAGFEPTGDVDYAAAERAVTWQAVSLQYTFIVLALRRRPDR